MPASVPAFSVPRLAVALLTAWLLGACANPSVSEGPGDSRLLSSGSRDGSRLGAGSGRIRREPLGGSSRAGDLVYFDSDSAELTAEGRETLARKAQSLRQSAARSITIEGHADERGTREYNIGLGARRANAVKAFLVAQGMQAGQVRTMSFGKERPVAVCDDISCWSQNRRALVVTGGS